MHQYKITHKKNISSFKKNLIDENRGKPLFLIRIQNLDEIDQNGFIQKLISALDDVITEKEFSIEYNIYGQDQFLLIGLGIPESHKYGNPPNIDGATGRFHDDCMKNKCRFEFGIGRTQGNYISDTDEIFNELDTSSRSNLNDNLVRWSWTSLNRANDYFANEKNNAVIQPIIFYNHNNETFSLKGGEVFVGGNLYNSYSDLMFDIPDYKDTNRIELLILEKLIMELNGAPGLLKFNISPQTLIDTFYSKEKVERFFNLIKSQNLNPVKIRLELVEKPYEENKTTLLEVCNTFWQYGISFAADDFGVKSQSHQVVLQLGEMIKEFKLDPISFKFKPEDDHTKFLDNLAFLDYCMRLADNRDAIITAEALEDYDTLRFLIAHKVYYFQTFILSNKMSIEMYKEHYDEMQDLPEEVVQKILTSDKLSRKLKAKGNIFLLARDLGLF